MSVPSTVRLASLNNKNFSPGVDAMASEQQRATKADVKAAKAHDKAMRPWYKKKRFIIPGAVVVLGIAAGSGADGGPDTKPTSSSDQPQEQEAPAPSMAGMNQPARDGKFEFVVSSMQCGATEVGEEFLTERAQGQFCLLDVTVKNIGKESQTLSATNQYLLNDADVEYSASFEASFAYNQAQDTDVLFEDINPGNSISGTFVFDVPMDAQITTARLHDSAFSGGILIDLA